MLNGGAFVIQVAARRHAQALDRWVAQVRSQVTAAEAFRIAGRPPAPPAVVASMRFAYRVEETAAKDRVEAILSEWVAKVDVGQGQEQQYLRSLAGHWPRQQRRLAERIGSMKRSGRMVIADQQDGETVFWSNVDGWVDRASATLFTRAENETVRLPDGNAPYWKDESR